MRSSIFSGRFSLKAAALAVAGSLIGSVFSRFAGPTAPTFRVVGLSGPIRSSRQSRQTVAQARRAAAKRRNQLRHKQQARG